MARIMVIASFAPSLVNFRGDMLRAFVARGHEVVCLSPAPDAKTLAALADVGAVHRTYPLQRAGLNPLRDLKTYRALRRIMREEKPDRVLAYTIKPVVYGCRAARKEGVPGIYAMITGLGTAFLDGGGRERLLGTVAGFLYRRALAGCRRVFFQNPDDRDLFLARRLVERAKCLLINGSGINLDRFPMVPVPPAPPVFLLIARLMADKGVHEFASAAARIRARYPAARFRLVGYFEDHPRAVARDEVDRWVDAGTLAYLGTADDVRPHLGECTVYCLPTTHREGLPRTVLEAMATGRAIVTTDVPGCRETVVEGENGHLVPPGDADALAAALARYCEDPGLAVRHGAASRRLAEQRFDVHRVNEAIVAGMEI